MQRSTDFASFKCLTNSLSRFIHLASCCTSGRMPAQKDVQNVVALLKHLKPVLDGFIALRVPPDDAFFEECEDLDAAVNDSREFLEKWSPRTSKIITVLRSKPLLLRIQMSSVKLSRRICRQLESAGALSSLSDAQLCLQESQDLKIGQLSECMTEVLRSQKGVKFPVVEHLREIIELLCLISSQELLVESMAIEKEKQLYEESKNTEGLDQVSLAAHFMSYIRDYMVHLEDVKARAGAPVPSYFRCPLSLELMSDPVIVASGQTYERAAIQKWLDYGLLRCPKTGMLLSHRNLIPNFTVKDLIVNWCRENGVVLCRNQEKQNAPTVQHSSRQASHESDFRHSMQSGSSTSRSLSEARQELHKLKGEGCLISSEENEKLDQSSGDHSYAHSRSESVSSAFSSIDYVAIGETDSRIPSKPDSDQSGEMRSSCYFGSRSKSSSGFPPSLDNKYSSSSKSMSEVGVNGSHNTSRSLSFPSESGCNETTSESHVAELMKGLNSDSKEVQTAAAGEIRLLAKYNMDNRVIIGECGAIPLLISLLYSDVELIQEHAVTALLNLSINEKIKVKIAESSVLEPLIHVLETGNAGAKENAAAALFSISLLEEFRVKIGRSGAVKALIDLLQFGTVRGKKDAATALFNLSIYHENKARIVQAGAVKHLIGFLDPVSEMVDKAVALLANLSTIAEGSSAIACEGGIPLLVEIIETGSRRGKENAAAILLQLCITSPSHCRSILLEGAVPPLVALSQTGTPRAKEKAQQLLSHFRNQREGMGARGR